MGIDIKGLDQLNSRISRIDAVTSKAQLQLMREYSKKIADKARDFAPVDEGNLENSIVVVEKPTGINRRLVSEIGVDTSKLGSGYTQRGYPYHIAMHEDPSGTSGNGPLSREKAERLGVMVGPKYMTRALDHYADQLNEAFAKAVREALR